MKTEVYPCLACGVLTERPLARGQKPKWCPTCRRGHRRERTCEGCGKLGVRGDGRYCSRACFVLVKYAGATCPIPDHHPIRSTPLPPGHPARRRPRRRPRFMSGMCAWCGHWYVTDTEQFSSHQDRHCSRLCARKTAKQARKARRRSSGATEVVSRSAVFRRDGWRCHLCRRKLSPDKVVPHPRAPTIDHVIPLAKGGLHVMANVRTACYLCNCLKGDRGGGEQLMLFG